MMDKLEKLARVLAKAQNPSRDVDEKVIVTTVPVAPGSIVRASLTLPLWEAYRPVAQAVLDAGFDCPAEPVLRDELPAGPGPNRVRNAGFDVARGASSPDACGWIEWNGGGCPVAANTIVDVQFRVGGIGSERFAGGYSWEHVGDGADIVAYRIVKRADDGAAR
ncbi:MAG: hypothetical protein JO234_04235 [Hyphomicrobiales bacterium]|nr:hypothetical protein [Hyphomicrobiales bacterium]